jgi:hypothetical protein
MSDLQKRGGEGVEKLVLDVDKKAKKKDKK